MILSHLAVLLTTDGSASLTMKLRKGTFVSVLLTSISSSTWEALGKHSPNE